MADAAVPPHPARRPPATRCSPRWPTSSAEVLAGRTHHGLMPAPPNPVAIRLHGDVAEAVQAGDAAAAAAAMQAIIDEASDALRDADG